MNDLTPQKFFFEYFPDAYVCAMRSGGGQFEGRIIDKEMSSGEFDATLAKYQELNKSHCNIFFTPNGAKFVDGRNSLSNLKKINAWWIDIDIDETKTVDDDETKILRENRKAEIAGHITLTDPCPSLTIETRNGFQLYWFVDHSTIIGTDDFLKVGNGIYEHFKHCGADKSTVKIMQLMRVPNFYYIKNGEIGKIKAWPLLSTFQKYTEATMMKAFPYTKPEILLQDPYDPAAAITPQPKFYKPNYQKGLNDTANDIFIKVTNLPIDDVLNKISGHWLVNGDMIEIQKQCVDRSNITVNGKPAPNFIVRSKNHLYSNNADEKGPTIIQYLHWYGWSNGRIAEGLKELF